MRNSTLPVVALLAAGGLISACGLNQEGVPPLRDAIAFPASALVDPTGAWLYVANSNSDLRYNDGTLVAVDLAKIEPVLRSQTGRIWENCPQVGYVHPRSNPDHEFCCWDQLDRNVLNCDERQFIPPTSTVRIGSFASSMVWQETCPPDPVTGPLTGRHACRTNCNEPGVPDGRLYIGVRGNSSITYVDVTRQDATHPDPVAFDCGGADQDFPECDGAHQITVAQPNIGMADPNNPKPTPVLLPDEPYALALDQARALLYVGHLRGDSSRPGTGGLSLFDVVDPSVLAPKFVGPFGSIFPPDGNGLFGVTSLTPFDLHGDNGEVFVTSRYLPRVGAVIPTNIPATCDSSTQSGPVMQSAILVTGDGFDTTLAGAEVRGIQFIPGAERAFVLQRVPPALIGLDLGTDEAGARRITPSEVIETCSSPTFLQLHDAGGAGVRLFVTCFETGQVYVVDPYIGRVTRTIDVGRGPAGLRFGAGPGQDPAAAQIDEHGTRAYVVGFGDNNVSVLDLQPGSPTEYHVVLRLGFPSTVPR